MRETPSDQSRSQALPVKSPWVTMTTMSSTPARRNPSHAETSVPPVSRMSSTRIAPRPTAPARARGGRDDRRLGERQHPEVAGEEHRGGERADRDREELVHEARVHV